MALMDDLPNDRQMLETGVFVPIEGDTMLTIDSPIRIDGAEKVRPRRAPALGQHSDEVLREAGYDGETIGALRAGGVVG